MLVRSEAIRNELAASKPKAKSQKLQKAKTAPADYLSRKKTELFDVTTQVPFVTAQPADPSTLNSLPMAYGKPIARSPTQERMQNYLPPVPENSSVSVPGTSTGL